MRTRMAPRRRAARRGRARGRKGRLAGGSWRGLHWIMLTTMMPKSARYTTVAVVLHWIVAAVVIGQFALGWLMQEIPKSPPGQRAAVFNVHKSIGLTILALMVVR